MLKILSACFILVFSLSLNAAITGGVSVTVEVPLSTNTDERVRSAAKNKAVLAAMERLPAVLWGQERSIDGDYSENIQAVGFAQAEVSILSERFDREAGMYELNASVSWDPDKIKHMLAGVSDGEKAKKIVTQIKALAQSATLDKYIASASTNALSPRDEAILLVNPFFYSTSYAQMKENHLSVVSKLVKTVREHLVSVANSFRFTLEHADASYLYYEVTKPATSEGVLFSSDILTEFFERNQQDILSKAGNLCFFNPTQLRLLTDPILRKSGSASIKVAFATEMMTPSHAEMLYKGEMQPLDVLICDDKSFASARSVVDSKDNYIKRI